MAHVVALCGGVGGAKLAHGLTQVLRPEELVVVVNTGDDFEHLGLRICPDIDTVLYTLAGRENREYGWGRAEESWRVMDELAALQAETCASRLRHASSHIVSELRTRYCPWPMRTCVPW